jgi:cytoskeletal protein RodZ
MVSAEKTLVDLLRLTREQRGESVEQVHQRTGISEKIIRSLETGGGEVVEAVYMRLAALTYAQHLNLDVDRVAELYDAQSGVRRAEPLKAPNRGAFAESTAPQDAFPTKPSSGSADLVMRLKTMPPAQIAVVAAVGVVLALIIYLLSESSPEPETMPTTTSPAPAALRQVIAARDEPEQRGANQPPPSAAPSAATESSETTPSFATESPGIASAAEVRADEPNVGSPPTPGEPTTADDVELTDALEPSRRDEAVPLVSAQPELQPLILQAHAVDTTWVRVRMDGLDSAVVTILPGEDRSWEARDFFMVRAGKPHGVRFTFQGDLLGDGRFGNPVGVLLFRASREGVALVDSDELPVHRMADSTAITGVRP